MEENKVCAGFLIRRGWGQGARYDRCCAAPHVWNALRECGMQVNVL